MKNDMLGLIFAENPEASMGELTAHRSLAAVPFGGRYRIIDFMLSNMVNSSIVKVGITTQSNYRSLVDHLGTGKAWDMDRKTDGLFILPINDLIDTSRGVIGGIDIVNGAMHFLQKSSQEYALVADCNTICNIDFSEVLKAHIEKEADITMICNQVGELTPAELKKHILIDKDQKGRIRDIQAYPVKQNSNMAYMNMFLIKRELLMDLVGDGVAHAKHFITKEILIANINRLNISAYEYEGTNLKIDGIKTFYNANLMMLEKDIRDDIMGKKTDSPVYTKVKDTIPTKYGAKAEVSGSIIANGCVIEGAVKNSILFRGVHVGKGASVENCVIMQDSDIMENCLVENVIFDKEVILRSGKKLIGQDTYPMIIGKKTIV